jgi:hypothetical protein
MPPLPRVYAYRDERSMGPTRWSPRLTVCTLTENHNDLPGKLYVAKFCQGAHGAAAMISEVVCRELFRAGGLHVLDAVVVEASETFAGSWNKTNEGEKPIVAGSYFGTAYVPDPYGGSVDSLEQVESPQHLALIWLLDCLVCNIDREIRGNLMLLPRGPSLKLRVLPADNSDCFCGSLAFSNGQWRDLMRRRGPASGILVLPAIAAIGGEIGLRIAMQTVRAALDSIGGSFDQVPPEWWVAASIQPEQVEETLWERMDALPELINVAQWTGGFTDGDINGIPLIQL